MSVQFLSTEWAEALKAHLNGNDAFKQAAQGQNATIQQVITGGDGETLYWIRIADAAIDMGVGQAENPDATITQSYETAVALAKSELSPVTAFMTGKVKVGGNMGLLLSLQGVLTQLPDAMRAIDVQYAHEVQAGGETATVTCARASTAPSSPVTSASANTIDRPARTTRPCASTVPRAPARRYCTSRFTVTWPLPGSIAERTARPAAVSASVAMTPPCRVPPRLACSPEASIARSTSPSRTSTTRIPIPEWNGEDAIRSRIS